MAEDGIAVDQDETQTMSSFHEAPPSVPDILVMSVDELRTELHVRGVAFSGGNKPELQVLLLQDLGYVGNPHRDLQDGQTQKQRDCSRKRPRLSLIHI